MWNSRQVVILEPLLIKKGVSHRGWWWGKRIKAMSAAVSLLSCSSSSSSSSSSTSSFSSSSSLFLLFLLHLYHLPFHFLSSGIWRKVRCVETQLNLSCSPRPPGCCSQVPGHSGACGPAGTLVTDCLQSQESPVRHTEHISRRTDPWLLTHLQITHLLQLSNMASDTKANYQHFHHKEHTRSH